MFLVLSPGGINRGLSPKRGGKGKGWHYSDGPSIVPIVRVWYAPANNTGAIAATGTMCSALSHWLLPHEYVRSDLSGIAL